MDTSEYMPMFIAETREHLEQLNLAIVRLEEDPKDRATVEEIFRIAHSLKGMSATMGFSAVAELTHEMEDVFELLRQRTNGLPVEAIDTVFACLDALSAATEAIETDGDEALDPAPLVARLRSLVRPRTPEQEMARAGAIDPLDHATIKAAQDAGARVLHVRVTLADEVLMPAVRAHMVLVALTDHGEVLVSAPAPDVVEQFQGREIEAWVASDHEDETIAENVRQVSEVFTVEVNETPTPGSEPTEKVVVPAAEIEAPAPEVHAAVEPVAVQPAAEPVAPAEPAAPRRSPPRPPRPPRLRPRRRRLEPCVSTPSGSTRSCTRWASSSSTAPRSRRLPRSSRSRASSTPSRSSRAAPRPCRRWSCRSG